MTDFRVGDAAWWARCGFHDVERPCPICFGKREVKLTLGDGSEYMTPCEFCGIGYDGPRGYVVTYEWTADPVLVMIRGVRVEATEDGEQREYFQNTSGSGYVWSAEDLFATRDEAAARCAIRVEEHAAEEEARVARRKENDKKSYSWHVGYHLREAKYHAKKAAYHESRAVACRALARGKAGGDE